MLETTAFQERNPDITAINAKKATAEILR